MEPFTPFLTLLAEIEDPRRAEGKLYRLSHVMLFAIMAIVAGANSYRTIHTFIDVHLARLREAFHLPRPFPCHGDALRLTRQSEGSSSRWKRTQLSRSSGAMPPSSTSRPAQRSGVLLRSTARCCAGVLTASMTARPPIS